ncbi:hypothetical protein [Microbacterium sp. p3-SID336]|uniref:hypothetical protein n=1 Tax=Microbacterium sp. p3-SID336 TaxID=2916212 RepID=UPI0021A71A6E|nr:hypothetical protein [Microbacterium sp. p3-SID336]MCT1478370.1 hypothetical protein [Microbacterium sp. p3-SID336]
MRRTRATIGALVGLMLVLTGVPTVASAGTGQDERDSQTAQLLEEVPGGELVAPGHIVWPELDMEFTAAGANTTLSARSVGSCATGRICAYTAYGLSGSILSWGTCGSIAIPSTFTARSVANARTSGYAQVRNNTTVLATVYANGSANIYGAANNIRCYL